MTKKTIFITGATGTLGRTLALSLATPNTHFILLDKSTKQLETLDDDLEAKGSSATLIPLNLKEPEKLEALKAPLLEKTQGNLHHVFSCHGVMHPLKPTLDLSLREWQEALHVNLTSNWFLAKLTLPLLQRMPQSTLTFFKCPLTEGYDAAYQASKAGLEALVKALKQEQTPSHPVTIEMQELPPFPSPFRKVVFPGGDPRASDHFNEALLKITHSLGL